MRKILVLFAAIVALALGIAIAGNALAKRSTEPCCFSNPRFAGKCAVQPGEDETCASILGYLNNPRSIGKTYCGNTQIRGGWQRTPCD